MDTPTPAQVLATPMGQNDSGAATVHDYLIALLAMLWQEREEFNSKRPFGNSGWESDLDRALLRAGYVAGELDNEGYVEDVDTDAVDRLIAEAIQSLSIAPIDREVYRLTSELGVDPRTGHPVVLAIDADCPSCGYPERWFDTATELFGCPKCTYTSRERTS